MEQAILEYLLGMVGPWGMIGASMLGMLVIVAECVVILTPSKKDDEKWAQIKKIPVVGGLISALSALAPIKKKD